MPDEGLDKRKEVGAVIGAELGLAAVEHLTGAHLEGLRGPLDASALAWGPSVIDRAAERLEPVGRELSEVGHEVGRSMGEMTAAAYGEAGRDEIRAGLARLAAEMLRLG